MRSLLQITLSTAFVLSLFSGCAQQQPKPEEKKQLTDPTLPVVQINGHISDMRAVAFEWQKVKDPRVAGFNVYRNLADDETGKLKHIDTVESHYVTHYLDEEVKPDKRYNYRFTTFNAEGAESHGSETVTVTTLPVIASVSFFASIDNMPRSAKLIWRPHTNPKVKGYRIERKRLEEPEWTTVDNVNGRLSAEFIDTGLKDNGIYKYRLRAITYDKIVSTPSEIVTVTTKPLPTPVENIAATRDLPKKIVLTWAPHSVKDFDYYKIYRNDDADGTYDYHVKTRDTRFEDTVEEDGKVYFYKIAAVDKDGLESQLNPVPNQGSTLIKPMSPVMTKAFYSDNSFRLHWQNSDARTVSYTVIKTTHQSWINKSVQEIVGVKQTQFTDIEIAPDTRYEYQVVAVDEYGIASEPTEAVELSFKAEK
jgi:fibronectin type 3 domain-containing protein